MSVDFGIMFIGLWTRRYIEQTPRKDKEIRKVFAKSFLL
jgi:hypothetical protein